MKWFLAFLVANMITFTYASMTLFTRLSRLSNMTFIERWLSSLREDAWVGALFIFASICDILVMAFLLYHCYLIFCGVTTNESLKFADVQAAIDSGDLRIYKRNTGYKLEHASTEDGTALADIGNIYDRGWYQNLRDLLNST